MQPEGARIGLCVLAGFAMGSIPFGPIVARGKGVDLTKTGSGNIGATNVLRSVGKGAAALTLVGDALKGTLAVALARALGLGELGAGLAGLAAVLGHDFSPFMRFRGGKGVATSLGMILIYVPGAGMLTLVLWLLAAAATRISSAGALVSFSVLPFVVWLLGRGAVQVAVAAALSALLIARHHGNLKRIIEGTERRIGEKKL
jgi:glycerol-3-phosphate acyltransferase PlsY